MLSRDGGSLDCSDDRLIETIRYSELTSTHTHTHTFFPLAIETAGTWHEMATELTQEIGRRITTITERYDTRCYFNAHSKANMSQLNLPHGNYN